jgi:2-polyprenyl-3-methyl-5-hydroxy-6-metoxy-1,4-benzoquinol methylase
MQNSACGSTGNIAKGLPFHIQNQLLLEKQQQQQAHGQTVAHSSQTKVTAEWDAMAGDWDDIAKGYRDSFVKLFWVETGYTTRDQQKDLVVVDFGCGTGILTEVIRTRVKQIVGLDAAPSMVQVLQDKIKAGEWSNVNAYCAVVANLDASPTAKVALDALKSKVDIVVASSVLNFIPEEDMEATMISLGSLLKPETGMLIHSDWPHGEEHPNGFSEEKARNVYRQGGLQATKTKTVTLQLGEHAAPVFVGVANRACD